MKLKPALVPLTMPLLLAACFGGGGGGSSSGQSGPLTLDSTPTAFTSFDDITANSLVEAQSGGGSVNYNAEIIGGNVDRDGELSFLGSAIRLLSLGPIDPEDPDSELEFGGLRLTVNLPGATTLSRDFLDEPDENIGTGLTAGRYVAFEITNDDDVVTDRLYSNEGEALEYMTFGLWELGIGQPSIDVGGAAWGATTPLTGTNAMPTVGTVTYQGDLIGYNVIDTSTTIYVATSNLEANFGTNSVTFSSTGTRNLATGAAAAIFDLTPTTGTITGNTFAGTGLTITALPPAGGPPPVPTGDGSFGGAFFGPNAAEAGGWFEMRNLGNNDRYFGSFGGAQLP